MKLIIDTDSGIDDAIAILMALSYPNVQLLALSTVMGNVPLAQATHNAAVILDVAGAPSIPIFRGCPKPLLQYPPPNATNVHGTDGLGGAGGATTPRSIQPEPASLALIRLVRENPGQITLLAIGPLTNIALAIHLAPDFLTNLKRLVIMGGSIDGRGNTSPAAEFNVLVDPEAAAAVFTACQRADTAVTLISWETTLAHPLTMANWESLITGIHPVSLFVKKMTEHIKQRWHFGSVLWPDPLAASVALEPDIVTEAEFRTVTVDCGSTLARGHTVVDYRAQARPDGNACLVRKVNIARFVELLRLAVN